MTIPSEHLSITIRLVSQKGEKGVPFRYLSGKCIRTVTQKTAMNDREQREEVLTGLEAGISSSSSSSGSACFAAAPDLEARLSSASSPCSAAPAWISSDTDSESDELHVRPDRKYREIAVSDGIDERTYLALALPLASP